MLLLVAIGLSFGVDRAVARSSSAGRPEQKLQWLPYRPSKPRVARRKAKVDHSVRIVSATDEEPSATAEQVAAQSGTNPFNDPFGDGGGRKRSASRSTYPTLAQQAIARKQAPAEPIPMEPNIDPPDVLPPDVELPAVESPDVESPDVESTIEPTFEDNGYELDDDEGYDLPSDQLARAEPDCPSPLDEEYFTPIGELTTDVSIRTDGDRDPADVILPQPCSLPEKTYDPNLRPSTWASTSFAWKASGLCHKPLYFEDVHLERYGHSWGPYLQPVISGAHFFLTVPILPYKMGLNPPSECLYTLGYYRPGSCAPYLLDPIPLSIRAAFAQGGVSTGMAFLIP